MLEMSDFPSQALLMSWLSAPDAAGREAALRDHADALSAEALGALLALAEAGPSYGARRAAEAGVQVALLELAAAVADWLGELGPAARARRLLASTLEGAEREALLVRAAHDAETAGDWREWLEASRALAAHHAEGGRAREALLALESALHALMRLPDGIDEAAGVMQAALGLAERAGQPAMVLGLLHQWVDHARERGDRTVLGQAQTWLGGHLVALGEYEEAVPALGEALALLGEMADDETLVRVQLHLLVATYALGRTEAAGRHLEAAITLRSRIEDPEVLAELERQFGQLF